MRRCIDMGTLNELLMSVFVFSIAIIFLTELFFNIIKDRLQKIFHSHTPPNRVDKRNEGNKRNFSHGASRLLAFLLITFLQLINVKIKI